jgi:hypothetical protein
VVVVVDLGTKVEQKVETVAAVAAQDLLVKMVVDTE